MSEGIEIIKHGWKNEPNRTVPGMINPNITFSDFVQKVLSVGPFYYYIIDFETMEMSNVNPAIADILGHDPATVQLEDVLSSIHPEDVAYVGAIETCAANYFYKHLPPEKILNYKTSFNFRMRLKDGNYGLFNHQAIMLQVGARGGLGKCLNIHTQIDHLTDRNNYRFSLISLTGDPSFLNLKSDEDIEPNLLFSNKELEILKLIADGFENKAIAEKLFISILTVQKHRANILKKSDCKNMTELVKISYMNGLI